MVVFYLFIYLCEDKNEFSFSTLQFSFLFTLQSQALAYTVSYKVTLQVTKFGLKIFEFIY